MNLKVKTATTKLTVDAHWLLKRLAWSAGLTLSEYLRLLVVSDLSAKGLLLSEAQREIADPVTSLKVV